jgi:hypothetical protein
MNEAALIQSINKDLALQLPETIASEQLHETLAAYINKLINTNFETLVSLLYRIDVSEAKIKSLLANNPEKNAGDIIAALIIERQEQKIKSRQQFSRDGDISEEEKW